MGQRVESVDWGGFRYRRYPDSKRRSDRNYFKRSFTGGTAFLHREVWEQENGPVPEGHHIHHVDGDTSNNTLDNLVCVSVKEHAGEHWDEDRRNAQKEWLDSIRHLSAEWHSTPEGLEHHRRIGGMAYKNFVPVEKACEQCEEPFKPKAIGNRDRFCSNKCKSAWRRASGVDDVTRICECCDKEFRVSKYSKTRVCSRSCANRVRGKKKASV